MRLTFSRILLFVLCFGSCTQNKDYLLVEVDPSHTGLVFQNTLKNSPDLNILNYLYYYNGSGIIAADFNNDQQIDLFFGGNEVPDALYINQGNLKFKEITAASGISPHSNWTTGATYVDINSDGLLDIYICKASGYRGLNGKNLLYVNQGIGKDGLPKFKEEAAAYGLDFSGLSTHAAFFDYDLDGDLDMYLLNHSVHPNRNYGHGNLRKGYHPQFGDILFKNSNGFFEDVSQEAGIYQGKTGYGLGLSIGDINNDGFPDIYIGNDFFENDYLYINLKNGKFKEVISEDPTALGHTSHFSMGNTISDLNNDGWADIISLDMLPENLETYKSSGVEYGYPIYRQYLNKGYSPQYMQNTFHLNLDGERFSEIAYLSGIAATEWSWGVLPVDLDNDGFKDLYISNGIVGATNDMDYMNFIANEDIQKRIDKGMVQSDVPLTNEIPQKKVPNYVFRNQGDLSFKNVSSTWTASKPSFSNGCVYADFDNDGDLDIVVNTINAPIIFLENTSKKTKSLTLRFKGTKRNPFGIGAKVILYGKNTQTQENYPTKGYLSTVPPELYFGMGKDSIVDSLRVIWPDGKEQLLKEIPINQGLTLHHEKGIETPKKLFDLENNVTIYDSIIPFTHKENISLDFDREPLVPFANSNEGPGISVSDFNKDGFQDIFIGGAKKQSSELFAQDKEGNFYSVQKNLFYSNSLKETTCSLFFDANNDGWEDLVIGYGGNEFSAGKNIQPQLYLNQKGHLELNKKAFENAIMGNLASIVDGDIDGDGAQDLILISDQIPGSYGETPQSFILLNNGNGEFSEATSNIAPDFNKLGNLKSVKILDINRDGKNDLITIGHWIPISVFLNDGEQLILQKNNGLDLTNGLWNSIELADFDKDGDLDIIAGNWGLNSKLKASMERPITLYRDDFDNNTTVDPIITHFHGNVETPFASKDELVKQLPFLNKEFLSYTKFAQATITDLFSNNKLNEATQKKVFELETCYFENQGNNRFHKKDLPKLTQASQIREIRSTDINNDGFLDILLMGNNFHISTQLGRMDALHGLLLLNDGMGNFKNLKHLKVDGQVNTIQSITIKNKKGFIIGRNDERPIFLTKKDSL